MRWSTDLSPPKQRLFTSKIQNRLHPFVWDVLDATIVLASASRTLLATSEDAFVFLNLQHSKNTSGVLFLRERVLPVLTERIRWRWTRRDNSWDSMKRPAGILVAC